jgi:hypothetical protein
MFAERELCPTETLTDAGLVDDSVVESILRGELAQEYSQWVIVITESKRFRYGVNPSETVDKFLSRFASEERFFPSTISFGGQPLPKQQSLGNCGVSTGSLLTASGLDWFKVDVTTLTNKTRSFRVRPNTRVEVLKAMIQNQEGIPPDQQRLFYCGRQLEDGNSLEDYQVKIDARLMLVLRLRG